MPIRRPPGSLQLAADRSGNVMLEFALALPILTLLLVGLLDLGSFGLQKSAMLQGARAGAQYAILVCSDSTTCAAQSSNINSTAQGATGLSGVTATNSPFCECVTGTQLACTPTPVCASGQTLKRYITVNTTKAFSPALAVAALNFASFGNWTPPTLVSASVTMIVP
jgi:Flp pilus assembly protein TadG